MLHNDSHIAFLRYLMQQGTPVTAKNIAAKLGVSVRTVKNYASAINDAAPSRVVFSSASGYHVERSRAVALMEVESGEKIPQTYRDRAVAILRKLTVENYGSLDLYDLCSELCVSYSTLRNDISKMNREYGVSGIRLDVASGELVLVGDEADKRKLISQIIFTESSGSIITLSVLKRSFPSSQVDAVAQIVRLVFSETGYYLNDFSYMNLVLHVLILVARTRSGESTDERDSGAPDNEKGDRACAALCDALEREFSIKLNDNERRNVRGLVTANAYFIATGSFAELRQNVGDRAVDLTLEIATAVRDSYAIDLASEEFLVAFTMHLKSMMQRADKGTVAPCPMLETIKRECPLTFDIAAYVAIKLQPYANAQFSDDEIAYIALHVGAEVERQKLSSDKVPCMLICPKYRGMAENLYNKLLIQFGNRIAITRAISFEDEADSDGVDLILSTVHLNRPHACHTIVINPLAWQHSQTLISNMLDQIILERKTRLLRDSFDRYFRPEHFFVDLPPALLERDALLDRLCDALESSMCTTPEFRYGVKRREQMSSTAFGNIAIPHSVQADAIESCIAIAVSPHGIVWGNDRVTVVLLIAMSGIEMDAFRSVYEALTLLFNDNDSIQRLCTMHTFDEFRQFVQAKALIG